MDTYLGLDFGGTKLLIGEMEEKGRILRSKRYATGVSTQQEATETILRSLEDYMTTVGFAGTPRAGGVGILGVTDHRRGLWVSINHEVQGPPVPLADIVARKIGLPVYIDNDVRSATTAELMLGHGQRSDDFIYVNVGTGIAAGVVARGHILRGANNNSGEVGHMAVNAQDTLPCACGRTGCVENIASGIGFASQCKHLAGQYPDTALRLDESGRMDVSRLFALADAGDPLSALLTENGIRALACTIMNLVRVTDPDTVILGGGIVSDGWLLQRLIPRLSPATMRGVHNGVMLSAFDPREVGLIGAAALGLRAAQREAMGI
ncbi:MAG: ROK family protein [Oscillospiraceae bacterium]|jgi:predicted NBD/HSP70 family sugar kinase|nr:ROK family protein [Oscillospiraceae bacterium]